MPPRGLEKQEKREKHTQTYINKMLYKKHGKSKKSPGQPLTPLENPDPFSEVDDLGHGVPVARRRRTFGQNEAGLASRLRGLPSTPMAPLGQPTEGHGTLRCTKVPSSPPEKNEASSG